MNTLKLMPTAACFAVFTLTHGVSADPPKKTASSQPLQTGTIAGYVRDIAGRPLASAQVLIVEIGEFTKTDNSGKFIFVGEEPGIRTLRISLARYQTMTFVAIVNQGSTTLAEVTIKISPVVPNRSVGRGGTIGGTGLTQNRKVQPDPLADGLLGSFSGDVGLHSTARSR